MPSTLPRDPRLRSLAGVMIAREQSSLSLLSQKFFRISEVSAALSISPGTLLRWIHEGRVTAVRTGPGGRWRINEQELRRLQGKAT
jgi:excisionase family DNA binding protein